MGQNVSLTSWVPWVPRLPMGVYDLEMIYIATKGSVEGSLWVLGEKKIIWGIVRQLSKLEIRVIKRVLKHNAVLFYISWYQNQNPEFLYHQKLVSHIQIGAETPEIAIIIIVECIYLSSDILWGWRLWGQWPPNFLKLSRDPPRTPWRPYQWSLRSYLAILTLGTQGTQ